MLIRTGQ